MTLSLGFELRPLCQGASALAIVPPKMCIYSFI